MKSLAGIAWLTLVSTATTSPAQIIVVDPSGNGHYTSLQAAIDAAPPQSVIRVVGGSYPPIVIRKSLTLLGDPPPRIAFAESGSGGQPAAITANGSPIESLTLSRFVIAGAADARQWTIAGPGILSNGFGQIRVYDSHISGAVWHSVTGPVIGASAIVATSAVAIHVTRSTLLASKTDSASSGSFLPDGAPGLLATEGTISVVDSRIVGGSVGPTRLFSHPSTEPCPCRGPGQTGNGGFAIVARSTYYTRSSLVSGSGSPVFVLNQSFGQQASGGTIDGGGQPLDDALLDGGPIHIGRVHETFFNITPTGSGALLCGRPARFPLQYQLSGVAFMDLRGPLLAIPISRGALGFRIQLPATQDIVGTELILQYFNGTKLSGPVLSVVLP